MTFFIMFACRNMCSGTPHDCTWYHGGVKNEKNSVKNLKKYSGNSVHLRIYAHVLVLSISKHIHLILCINFVMPSIDFLLFINHDALMRLLSTVHCMLEPKMTKRYVQTMTEPEYLQPLIILIHTRTYSCIRVYTCTYFKLYILQHTIIQHVYFESGCQWILLAMTYCLCCTLVPCIADSILPCCGLFDSSCQVSQAGLAAPKLPQPLVDLIDIAAPLSVSCSRVGTAIREA
jgi:hypothetical protein